MVENQKILFIHTVSGLVSVFNQLAREYLPSDTQVVHIVDELVLRNVLAKGEVSSFTHQRILSHALASQQDGVNYIQLTCSSISPCVDVVQPLLDIPILKIDEPMIRKAIHLGNRVGVLATVQTTLKPTTQLLMQYAMQQGAHIDVLSTLCEGAYSALMEGNTSLHEQIVLEYLQKLQPKVDVILLAQASMAEVIQRLPQDSLMVPILTSPTLAMHHLADLIQKIS